MGKPRKSKKKSGPSFAATRHDCRHCGRSISKSWWLRHQQTCAKNPGRFVATRRAEALALLEPRPAPPTMQDATGTYVKVPPALAPIIAEYAPLVEALGMLLGALVRK